MFSDFPFMVGNQNMSQPFHLDTFFPYLVRIYYRAVSGSVMSVYEKEYNLTGAEWRAMAVLGHEQPLSAGEVVERATIDKVKVSRAISGLTEAGFMERHVDESDRRKVSLSLTKKGMEVFETLVPMVQKREEELLDGLDEQERDTLFKLMERVRKNVEKIENGEDT